MGAPRRTCLSGSVGRTTHLRGPRRSTEGCPGSGSSAVLMWRRAALGPAMRVPIAKDDPQDDEFSTFRAGPSYRATRERQLVISDNLGRQTDVQADRQTAQSGLRRSSPTTASTRARRWWGRRRRPRTPGPGPQRPCRQRDEVGGRLSEYAGLHSRGVPQGDSAGPSAAAYADPLAMLGGRRRRTRVSPSLQFQGALTWPVMVAQPPAAGTTKMQKGWPARSA